MKTAKRAKQIRPRIRAFYAANPGESLTLLDMAVKFGCSEQQARSAVKDLQREGFALESVRMPALVRLAGAS